VIIVLLLKSFKKNKESFINRKEVLKMTWNEVIINEQKQDYYANGIAPFLKEEYKNYKCYPEKENIFKALYSIPSPDDVKVVIIGQDPYHEPGQAIGLSFAVSEDCKNPPSLNNIINEIKDEFNITDATDRQLYHGDLTYLAKQGVLLLNATLTVRKGRANSHANCGWQIFTDHLIEYLNTLNKPIVFMLWGRFAQSKGNLITNQNFLKLATSHPSPYSANRGFMGSGHFVQCNEFLIKNGLVPINWLGEEYV
jgi:uracil-DNA glycosylase